MCILNVEKLCRQYRFADERISVLEDVSLKMQSGEMVAVMGPSGSGKTTLLHTLSGIDIPDAGRICVAGKELTTMSEPELSRFRRTYLGMVFQDFQLLESLTVKENILVPLSINRMDVAKQEQAYQEIIQPLGIQDIGNRYITGISGGQKQRTAIARAFIHKPKLVLADEPTGNLDFHSTTEVMQSFVKMNRKNKTGILIVTHDVYVASFCQRVLFLKDGCFRSELRNEKDDFKEKIAKMLYRMGVSCHDPV